MKRFDYENLLEQYQRKGRKSLIIFVILLVCLVATFLTGVLVSNYQNRILIMVIFSIVLAVLSVISVIIFIFGFLNFQKKKKQIFYILGGYLLDVEGKIISLGNTFTTVFGRQGVEIVLQNENKICVLYDPSFGDVPFKEGDHLKAKISESFIIQYEVLDA